MAADIQKTKLYIPAARAGLVVRTRLTGLLDQMRSPERRVGLISAPAGAGKTTLVVQWLQTLDWPVAWLSLDERDNSIKRFFTYIAASLNSIKPGTGEQSLALLNLPGVNPEEVVTLLANDLAQFSQPAVLVLDDFHTISNPQLLHALDLFIDAQPPQMRLFIITREDPAIPLARRRARAELVELRQVDLRFTLEEAQDFLNCAMDLDLTTGQVQKLEERTEGWITGLQLAALSLQRTIDTENFLENFTGSHRFILDYLVEEVLANQPEEVHDFLLETSILERMSAALCAVVCERPAAEMQNRLEELDKANLFFVPLDQERGWYRYHHLFRDLLLSRLYAGHKPDPAQLRLRASSWCEANGEHQQAVEYAFQAGEPWRAAELIERHISERWRTADIDFHLLIQRLPFEVISNWPSLCLQRAWLHVILGQIEQVLPFVEAAERALANPDRLAEANDKAYSAFALTLRAYLADLHNQPVSLDPPLETALEAIPEGNTGMRNSMAVVIGTIYFMEGDLAAALRCFQDALALDIRMNGTNAVPIATMRIVMVHQVQGRLREAMRRLVESETYVVERGIRGFYISGVLYVMMGSILLEWNRLDEAEDRIRTGLQLLEDWPNPASTCLSFSLLARICTARGDLEDAQAVLDRADALQHAAILHPSIQDAVEGARIRLLEARQDRAALEAWVEENEHLAREEMHFRYEARLVELGRAWLALGRSEAAVQLLERLEKRTAGRNGSRVAILSLLASAYGAEMQAAKDAVEEALRLGEPERYMRIFLDAGARLQKVLNMWVQERGSEAEPRLYAYAQKLLDASGLPLKDAVQSSLPEPLTSRELEVLQLLAVGLTNRQIAERLFISIRTVKKHVQNIHGKLGAQNRTEAVALAREAGLLDS